MLHRSQNKDLSGLNTFGMKVRAAHYIEYDNAGDLGRIPWKELAGPVLNMGEGSNLLFTGDFPGTVLRSRISGMDVVEERLEGDEVYVRVGAGETMDEFCALAARKGWWGSENLSGIPGTVGAAPVQNVGAYGVEACDIIDLVECYDCAAGAFVTLKGSDCEFAYRDSLFKHQRGRYIVHHVVFHLTSLFSPRLDYGHLADEVQRNIDLMPSTTDPYSPVYGSVNSPRMPLTPLLVRDTVRAMRDAKLPNPSKTGSAGSFFKNPVVEADVFASVENIVRERRGGSLGAGLSAGKGACAGIAGEVVSAGTDVPHFDLPDGKVKIPAAFLIDFCGFKGSRVGGAGVWESQPLVLVNATGKATPTDVLTLEKKIVDGVRAVFGIELSPEVDHI